MKISNNLYLLGLERDDYVIADGSPISFRNSGSINFAGKTHPMNPLTKYKTCLLQQIAGMPFAGLIGPAFPIGRC